MVMLMTMGQREGNWSFLAWNNTTDNASYITNVSTPVSSFGFNDDRQLQVILSRIVLGSYIPTCVCGLVGNGLIIFIIACNAQLRTKAYNLYIWNLAFADLFFTLTLPFFCYATFADNWLFGNFTCKLAHSVQETNKYASVFTLVALTVDRYLASYYNMDRLRTRRVGIGVCVIVWILCSAISVPFWMYAEATPLRPNSTDYRCVASWPMEHVSFYVTFMALFQLLAGLVIPFVVIITAYGLLARRLNRILRQSTTTRAARPSCKMTITVLVVVLTFLVCQAPYYAVEVIKWVQFINVTKYGLIPSRSDIKSFVILNAVAQILVFVSCCCNPIIYGLTNNDYRKMYRDIFCKGRPDNVSRTVSLTSWKGRSSRRHSNGYSYNVLRRLYERRSQRHPSLRQISAATDVTCDPLELKAKDEFELIE